MANKRAVGVVLAVWMAELMGCGAVFPRYTAHMRTPAPGIVSSGQLTAPPDSVQRITFHEADAPPSRRDGSAWDSDGTPDLFAVIYRNDQEIYRTPIVHNQIHASFPDSASVNIRISPESHMRVELWDEDGAFDDIIGRYEWIGMPASAMNGGNWLIPMENGAAVRLEANPPAAQVGMGLTYELHEEYALAVDVVPDGPAAHAGIVVGDKITSIDNRSVLDLGEVGTRQGLDRASVREVSLMVVHGSEAPRAVTVRCDAVYPALKQ